MNAARSECLAPVGPRSSTFAHVAFLAPHGNQRPTFTRWPTQANVVYPPPVVVPSGRFGQQDGGGNSRTIRHSLFCLSDFFVTPKPARVNPSSCDLSSFHGSR